MCWFLECPGRCHRAMGHQSRKGGNVSRSSYLFGVVFLNCQWWCWWWCSKKCSKNDPKKRKESSRVCEPPTIVLKPFVKVCCMSFNHCCDKCVSSFMPFSCSKDVRLPVQLQRAMAAEAEAAREARAKVGDHCPFWSWELFLLFPPDHHPLLV